MFKKEQDIKFIHFFVSKMCFFIILCISVFCNAVVDVNAEERKISLTDNSMTQNLRASTSGEWILSNNGKWWYKHADGSYTQNDWEYINGKWYYFDSDGWMLTGWLLYNGNWFYLGEDGAMVTGWKFINNKWYYMEESGIMVTGWQYLSYPGANHDQPYYNYFDSNGHFITDSDYCGCIHGYSTFKDYRYTCSPDSIKYYATNVIFSSNQINAIQTGASLWKNSISNVSPVNSVNSANMMFFPTEFSSESTLAQTQLYINGNWTYSITGNWTKTNIYVDTDQGVIGSDTIAHEIGHAFGLSHRITNKNSIMCQLWNGRKTNTVQATDRTNLAHVY